MSARRRMDGAAALAGGVALAMLLALRVALPAGPLPLSIGDARFSLETPRWLCALAALPLLVLASRRSLADLARSRQRAALALRCTAVALLSAALASPIEHRPSERTTTVLAVDVSASMDDRALAAARTYVADALRQRGDHALALLTFARAPQRAPLDPAAIARHTDGSETDIERALALALGMLAPHAVPQIVLLSDGRESTGSLAQAAQMLADRGVRLHVALPAAAPSAEVAVRDLTLPRSVQVGEPFEVRATVTATAASRVRATLLQDGTPNPGEPTRALRLPAGDTALAFRSVARAAGPVHYRLSLAPESGDRFAENNAREHVTVAEGSPRVLYVERERAQARPFAALLTSAGFSVDVRGPEAAPDDAAALAKYAFYVLSDVPADALSAAAMRAIAQFVREGGGFLMAGGERAFGAGGYRGSPLEPLLPVSLERPVQRDEPSLALVLAIDKSGSMAGDKLARAKEASVATSRAIAPGDYLGVLGFDTEPRWAVRIAVAHQAAQVARELAQLGAGGGTALFPALDTAYAALSAVRAKVKHVVVLTDGQTEEESLAPIARSMRADGITLSTIGLGDDVNRGLLAQLAELGGGRAYFTRDPANVPRLFTAEAALVARPQLVERRVHAQQVQPATFLAGIPIALAPPLAGYVETLPRAAPASLILATEAGAPLLARMRVGLGWSLALTTDVKPRWSATWYRWPPQRALFAQLVRAHMREPELTCLPIAVHRAHGAVIAAIDVLDDRERFVNGLTGTLRAEAPSGERLEAALAQVAPGRYEARLALPARHPYTLRAELTGAEGPPRRACGSFDASFSAEYEPPFDADVEGLKAAAARTGGGTAPAPARLFGLRDPRFTQPIARWPALVWLAIGLFALDLACRRLPAGRQRERA